MNDETESFFLSEAHFQNELFYRRAFKLFDKEKNSNDCGNSEDCSTPKTESGYLCLSITLSLV